MMRCLYRSDFGPADPGFDAGAAAQSLAKSFPAYTNVLATAQNPRQLEALLHRLDHGDSVSWCETGYVGALHPAGTDGFAAAASFILLPVASWCFVLWLRRRVLSARSVRMPTSERHEFASDQYS
jgi:hypothetical protein